MTTMTAVERKVVDAYAAGHSVSDIARMLELRTVEVIGIVRAHNVQPPSMATRRVLAPEMLVAPLNPPPPEPKPAVAAEAEDQAEMAARPRPERPARPAPQRPAARPMAAPKVAVPVADEDWDDEDEDEGPARRAGGRPRGWLLSEEAIAALYAVAGRRYEDVQLRQRPAPAAPRSLIQPAFRARAA